VQAPWRWQRRSNRKINRLYNCAFVVCYGSLSWILFLCWKTYLQHNTGKTSEAKEPLVTPYGKVNALFTFQLYSIRVETLPAVQSLHAFWNLKEEEKCRSISPPPPFKMLPNRTSTVQMKLLGKNKSSWHLTDTGGNELVLIQVLDSFQYCV